MKPPKKSDTSKTWMQLRKDRAILINPEYHLIVTEGVKTEPNYFQSMCNRIHAKGNGIYRGKIQIRIEGEGDNTLTLLERAVVYAKASPNPIKHVWLVYDKDDFPIDNFDNTAFRCKALSDNHKVNYHALWSNQCIEFWFLLHFDYLQSDLHRDKYYPKLTAYLENISAGRYKKDRDDMFELLLPYVQTGIRNAKKLIKQHSSEIPSQNAPGTKVYELIEKLQKYF